MRSFFILLLSALASQVSTQNTNVEFRSKITYSGQVLSNICGYAANGHEYALVGGQFGMIIVDVTNPDNPTHVVQIPGPNSQWREIKVYSNYAYIVSEGGSGVQIVNLSGLPGTNLPYQSYYGNGGINGQLTKAHALHIDVSKGFLYLYGTNLFAGKPVVLNLNGNPYSPNYAGYVDFIGYAHDGYVDNDILYTAHIFAGMFTVVNMANKSNPILLATQTTPGAFTHNTWRSGNTLFTTDENTGSYLASYDISNVNNITLLDKIQSNPGSGSIGHNTHIMNDFAITSWYKDGFTIVDVARPANMVQVGNYDTYPEDAGSGFAGDWGVYPYLPSGNIIVSNISAYGTNNGELWVMTPNYVRGCYLEGEVRDANTNNLLSSVKVSLNGTNNETTGSNGQFKLGQLQDGTFIAQFAKPGYVTQNIPVDLANGVLTSLNVYLQQIGLPIELLRFDARAESGSAFLHWETATEINNKGFEVQQSTDGLSWKVVGFVAARGSGTSSKPESYDFQIDKLSAGKHFFRLRQIDLDYTSQLTAIRSVEILGTTLVAKLLPNVVRDVSRISIQVEDPSTVNIEIFQSDAKSTGLRWTTHVEKSMDFPFSAEQLPPGTYFITVQTDRMRRTLTMVKE